jgi:PAS domain S-box-containing protein
MLKTRILVVEDEAIVAEDIGRSLLNLGYAVASKASSGKEAIKKAQETNPGLVLMDIVLQGEMDGIETANQIKTLFDIPVVYLTAFSDEKTLERAKITEPFGYMVKPFRERELHIIIEMALFKHSIEKKLKESREWFSVTLKSIGDAVIATDPEGYVLFMNPVALSMTGWKLEEARGKPLKDIFNIINEKAGEGQRSQTILISKDNKRISIRENSDAIKDEKGNIIGIVLVFSEIQGL